MKVRKEPIDPDRIRTIPPEGFSWIDRRFVREGFLERLPPAAKLLYFFLVAVGDARGLSFYADGTISRILELNREELVQSRTRLIAAELILYRHPIYQVLPMPARRPVSKPAFTPSRESARRGEMVSLSDLLKLAIERRRQSKETPEA